MYAKQKFYKGDTNTQVNLQAGGATASHYTSEPENNDGVEPDTDHTWIQIYPHESQTAKARVMADGDVFITTKQTKTTPAGEVWSHQAIALTIPNEIAQAIYRAIRAQHIELEADPATTAQLLAEAAKRQFTAADDAASKEAQVDAELLNLWNEHQDEWNGTLAQYLADQDNRNTVADALGIDI